MRVALLSTCAVAVPPRGYGGTELVVAELARALDALGHEVTVFATGDSRPAGELRYRFERPVWPPNELAELRHAAFAFGHVTAEAAAGRPYEIVHVHQAPSIAFAGLVDAPFVLTLHHHRDESLLDHYLDYRDLAGVTFVAISARQAALVPELEVPHVVHHGIDPSHHALGRGDGGYCAFLGRYASEKGPHLAVEAALAAEVPIRLGGRPHWPDRDYAERHVFPRLAAAGERARDLGELGPAAKLELLQGARALLFPIAWEEPFGLVMIEAMLVGTPVIALRAGSVPEIVEEGITGFVVSDVAAMAARLRALAGFDRARCRARALERWTATRMARDYLSVYECARRRARARPSTLWPREGAPPRPSRLPTSGGDPPREPRRVEPASRAARTSGA